MKQSIERSIMGGLIILFVIAGVGAWWLTRNPGQTRLQVQSSSPPSTALLDETVRRLNLRLAAAGVAGTASVREGDLRLSVPLAEAAALPPQLWQPGQVAIIDGGIEFPTVSLTRSVSLASEAQPDEAVYRQLIGPAEFLTAEADSDTTNYELRVTLSATGQQTLSDFVAAGQGIYLCLVVDRAIIGCPVMRPEGNVLIITPGPTDLLLDDTLLAAYLQSGALPVALQLAP